MNINLKNFKKYLNENGVRFNLNEDRIWNYIIETFGEERAEKLSNIFDEQYYNSLNDVNKKYDFCTSFKEATTLMYFQSDWFLKNSIIILEHLIKEQPKNILELGCYTGIFTNYLSNLFENSQVTGIDIQKNLIDFGNTKFKEKNLKLVELEYKNIYKLETKFNYIFTNFGLENIPNEKFDTYKLRENNNYKLKLEYFSNFFSYLNNVAKPNAEFLCIARIPTLESILSIVDGAQIQGWKWLNDDLTYIKLNNESIPKLRFIKQLSEKISLESFCQETLKLQKDNNQLNEILEYKKDIKQMQLLGRDTYKYPETNDELIYEVYRKDKLLVLFAWTTLGYAKYKHFDNKKNLVSFFEEEFGLNINPRFE